MAYLEWRAGREFNRFLKKKLDVLNIEFSFPHVTLNIAQNKQGQSNPFNIIK
jgi:hypothetical protein